MHEVLKLALTKDLVKNPIKLELPQKKQKESSLVN